MPRKVLAPRLGLRGPKGGPKPSDGVRLPVSRPKGSLLKRGLPGAKSKFGLVP